MTAADLTAAGKPMKVLFVATALSRGGLERSLAELLDAVRDRGIGCTVACSYRCPGGVEDEVLAKGHDVRFVPDPRLDRRVRFLRHLIRIEQPDLVHTAHTSSLAGGLAAFGTGIPVINSLVDRMFNPEVSRPPWVGPIRHQARRTLKGWITRHLATHVHAVSDAVKLYGMETLGVPEERITVVRRGRSAARLGEPGAARRATARRDLGLSGDEEVVLNVGGNRYAKGQGYLLEAVAQLAADRPRLRLLMAGHAGPTTDALRAQAAGLGLEEVVRFLGFRLDVPEVMAAADLFVCPSRDEGLPGAVIEAGALGLPIVASDITPVREVVDADRSALLVPVGAPPELAAAIGALLDDPTRCRAFGLRGRQIYLERFTLEQSVEKMMELFREIAVGAQLAVPAKAGALTGPAVSLAEGQE
jgi:glycosyltransferase involved in cell wall biosynthesis